MEGRRVDRDFVTAVIIYRGCIANALAIEKGIEGERRRRICWP